MSLFLIVHWYIHSHKSKYSVEVNSPFLSEPDRILIIASLISISGLVVKGISLFLRVVPTSTANRFLDCQVSRYTLSNEAQLILSRGSISRPILLATSSLLFVNRAVAKLDGPKAVN